jgi:hypothetical protein
MHAIDVAVMPSRGIREKPKQIASWGRLVGFLLIGAGVAGLGFLAQHAPTGAAGTAAAEQLASHGKAIQIYLTVGLMDWALLYFCWTGVRAWGGNLRVNIVTHAWGDVWSGWLRAVVWK